MFRNISKSISQIIQLTRIISRSRQIPAIDTNDLSEDSLRIIEPVFVLSTGRCGTKWLSELLLQDENMRVNHHDFPELRRHSRLAFESYQETPLLFNEVLRATRDEYLLDAHMQNKIYIETNPKISFFCHAILSVYPQAKFVHLYRHPGDFVRSGLRRGWYSGIYDDISRPTLHEAERWQSMTSVEKIAWLWNVTNQFIEDFRTTLPAAENCLQISAEDMFTDVETTRKLCSFIGAKIPASSIQKHQKKTVNQQRFGNKPQYASWESEEKDQLRKYAVLAKSYGYQL